MARRSFLFHVKNKGKVHPIGTLYFVYAEGNIEHDHTMYITYAKCHKKDHFSKKKSTMIVLGRMQKLTKIICDGEPFYRDLVQIIPDKSCPLTKYYFDKVVKICHLNERDLPNIFTLLRGRML